MNIRFPLYSKLMIFNVLLVGLIISFITFKNVELFKSVSLDREESYRLKQIDSMAKSLENNFKNIFAKLNSNSQSLMNSLPVKFDDEFIFYMSVGDDTGNVIHEGSRQENSGIAFSNFVTNSLKKNLKNRLQINEEISKNGFALIDGEKTPSGDSFVLMMPFKLNRLESSLTTQGNRKSENLFIYALINKDVFNSILNNDSLSKFGIYDSSGRLIFSSDEEYFIDNPIEGLISSDVGESLKNIPLQKYIESEGRNNSDQDSWLFTLRKNQLGMSVFSLISKDELLTPANYMKESSIFIIAIMVSILIYVLFLFSSQFSKPIEVLEDATKKVSEGNLDIKVSKNIKTRDEVKSLAVAFDAMVEGLKEREKMQNVLNKFHGSKVTEELLKKEISLGGEKKNVAILFSDIRGFTDFSEGHTSEEVVKMLNEYFEVMVGIINRHGGVVDKFIGDAIMAVWGIPHETEDDCKNALRACLDMRVELSELNQSRIERGLVPIKIGVGLHYGEAISGQIGSHERMEFTVIGDTVNTASRIEGATKGFGVDLLVSSSVLTKLDESFLIQKAGNVEVQGKSEALSLYQVDGIYVDGALKMLRTPYSHFEAAKDKKSKIV